MTAKLDSFNSLRIRGRENYLQVFFFLLSASLIACILSDLVNGAWHVHDGTYFPWRHAGSLWLYPPWVLAADWIGLAVSAIFLLRHEYRRVGIWLGIFFIGLNLWGRYANQRTLILIDLFFLALAAKDAWTHRNSKSLQPALDLIRIQIAIVYLFSAWNKVEAGFLHGSSLLNFAQLPQDLFWRAELLHFFIGPATAHFFSWTFILVEIFIPVALFFWPVAGFVATVAFHLLLMLGMAGVVPFSLIMIAMAALFLDPSWQAKKLSVR